MRVKVAELDDLIEGEIVRKVPDGMNVALALYLINGKVFVTNDRCTHDDASLSEGEIIGGEVVCPFHMGRFEICTGKATRAPCTQPLRTFHVSIIDEVVYVDL